MWFSSPIKGKEVSPLQDHKLSAMLNLGPNETQNLNESFHDSFEKFISVCSRMCLAVLHTIVSGQQSSARPNSICSTLMKEHYSKLTALLIN